MTEKRHRGRLLVAAAVMVLAFSGLGARLTYLQVNISTAERRNQINQTRRLEQDLTVGRGKILDRNGNILALDLVKKTVCADPAMIASNQQAQAVAECLAGILGMDANALVGRLNNPDNRFVYVNGYGKTIENEQARQITQRGLTGIFLNDVMVRTYPHAASMCHVLGYVNLERQGSAGIELQCDKHLHGVPGLLISEMDGRRRELYDRRLLEIKPRRGADVTLTLDQYVQYVVERAIENAMREHQAASVWAIVSRVRTGEILAMASRPVYDLNNVRDAAPEQMRNRCIANVYEPGSTFKVITISAALNEKVVSPAQVFDCENGTWYHLNRSLRDYHPYGNLSVADIVKKSSNIGTAKVGLLLGRDRLYRYLKAFGVGEPTGIELPAEEGGILPPLSKWSSLSLTRIPIGMGVAVTALQMLMVMSAVANDGMLMRPYIIKQVMDADGRIIFQQTPVVVGQPVRPETAAEMRRLLARVTEEGGTGHRASLEGYSVGGKTGTAQKPVAGGYSDTLNVASFVGFLPAEDPQLAVIVVLDEPKDVHTGGAVAAPVFKEIAEQAVRYLDIPPLTDAVAASRPRTGNAAEVNVAALPTKAN